MFIALVLACGGALTAAAYGAPVSDQIDTILGKKAQELPASVYKYSWPRTDLSASVDGTPITPGLALGSWAAFAPFKQQSWVMGDLVLLQSEVEPVIKALQAGGFEVMRIHNHLINDNPRVMYLHYMGQGDPTQLARGLLAVLEQTRTPLKAATKPAQTGGQSPPEWTSRVESALGRKGKLNGAVYAVSVPRADTDKIGDQVIPSAMGLETALNFQEIGNKVASTGDFVLISSEVNPVVKTLQQRGIAVTAIHSHMLDDDPRLFFLHYWALGNASEVGTGLKAALEHLNIKE
jgi:hypothetical protein